MTILVAAETLLLILLAVVVVALLRSHAEILRRLDSAGQPSATPSFADPDASPRREGAPVAADIAGAGLDGLGVQIGLGAGGPPTLIAFLTSGCLTCMEFWRHFSTEPPSIPGGGRLVIVVKDSAHESPTKLRELAPAAIPVVMSTATWERYEVPAAPYFIYVDGPSGEIHGEGAATSWAQVASLLRDALADAEPAERGASGPERSARIDEDLARAGIGPGHPSLYPDGESGLSERAS